LNANEQTEHQVFLGIGSNIDPQENLPRAVELLAGLVRVEAISRVWRTTAVGGKGPDFLNAALEIRTPLQAETLKREVLRPVEAQLGRVRTEDKYAPRTIDLDILIMDAKVFDPQIWEQAFLAVPLADILPGYAKTSSSETLAQAAIRLAQGVLIEPCLEPDLDCFLEQA
jgi:2-amino-4-hydroxy-6-hydroxymethyldihydropteridine diphosphokinase